MLTTVVGVVLVSIFEFLLKHFWEIILIAWGFLLLIVIASVRDNITNGLFAVSKSIDDLREEIKNRS